MRKMMTAVALALAAMGAVSQADATELLGLKAESGGAVAQTTGTGAIVLNQSLGNFIVNIDTASLVSNPLAFLMTANDITTQAGGTITVTGSAQNLLNPDGAASFLSQFSGTFLGDVGTIDLKTYYNASNTLFGTETLLNDLTGGPTSPFSISGTQAETTAVPFSVTEVLTVTLNGFGQVGTTGQIDGSSCIPGTPGCVVNPPVLPEPGSMMLLGSGLLGMAAVLRRRKRQ